MDPYRFLLLAFRIFVSADGISAAKNAIAILENDSALTGEEKRGLVVEEIKGFLKRGGVYILRGLIEVLLSQMRGENAE